MKWIRIAAGIASAAVLAGAAGSIVQSLHNLAAISAMGVSIPLRIYAETIAADLSGFAPAYMLLLATGIIPVFALAGWIARRNGIRRTLLFTLAGVAAVACVIGAVIALVPVIPIAAARTPAGFLLMALAGAPGGYAFARVVWGGKSA